MASSVRVRACTWLRSASSLVRTLSKLMRFNQTRRERQHQTKRHTCAPFAAAQCNLETSSYQPKVDLRHE